MMLTIKNLSIFSIPVFRNFRWLIYRKLFKIKNLFVDRGVVIVHAHKNKNSYFIAESKLNIGKNVYVDYSGGIKIGKNVVISQGSKIFTHNHNINGSYEDWQKNEIVFSELEIGNFVWIGANSIILPSVRKISDGSIVGAGTVLTKNTDSLGIYIGNPGRKIGKRIVSQK